MKIYVVDFMLIMILGAVAGLLILTVNNLSYLVERL